MIHITVTEEQARLIQSALDSYSRVGIGQLDTILNHPTYDNYLHERLRPIKELEVGDKTERGEIIEIVEETIKTKGSWGNGVEIKEWPKSEVKLSCDYGRYHAIQDTAKENLAKIRDMILDTNHGMYGSWGIYNPNVDESCRVAYDILQVIRHTFYKHQTDKPYNSVASSTHLTTKDSDKIKVEIQN